MSIARLAFVLSTALAVVGHVAWVVMGYAAIFTHDDTLGSATALTFVLALALTAVAIFVWDETQ